MSRSRTDSGGHSNVDDPWSSVKGAVLQNIDFALPPGAVVTGRVVDETGEAVAHVSVSLARRRYIEGARRLVAESGSSTDDRGEFRIFGVPPGDYVIVAKFDAMDLGSRDRVRYVPTYYPGTPVASEAQRVTVGAGQEVPGITIALARAATATVRGVVRSSGQASLRPIHIRDRSRDRRPAGVWPNGDGHRRRRRIVRDRRAASGHVLGGGAINVRVGGRVDGGRRRRLRRGRRNPDAVERRDGARPDPFRHGRPSAGASPVSGLRDADLRGSVRWTADGGHERRSAGHPRRLDLRTARAQGPWLHPRRHDGRLADEARPAGRRRRHRHAIGLRHGRRRTRDRVDTAA